MSWKAISVSAVIVAVVTACSAKPPQNKSGQAGVGAGDSSGTTAGTSGIGVTGRGVAGDGVWTGNADAGNADAGNAGGSGRAGTGGGTGVAGVGGMSNASGVIVPLYTTPQDATWDTIITSKRAHPAVDVRAIINPNSGPGSNVDASYVSGIARLSSAGIVVLGYVATGYGANPLAALHGQIDDYANWYPGVTGIFFDEMQSAPGGEPFYLGLTQYAKSKGFLSTVGNPGTDVAPAYVGTVDTILIYESAGLPVSSALGGWHAGYRRQNFGIIPYAVPAMDASFVLNARQAVQYIYLTTDDLPNPWDSLPPYFDQLLAALE